MNGSLRNKLKQITTLQGRSCTKIFQFFSVELVTVTVVFSKTKINKLCAVANKTTGYTKNYFVVYSFVWERERERESRMSEPGQQYAFFFLRQVTW